MCKEVVDPFEDLYTSEEENALTIRGKWIYDDCETIEQMILALKAQIETLEHLQKEGWFLQADVVDDYARLQKR